MSGLNEEQPKQESAQSDLLPDLIALMTKLVEQNSTLIEQANNREQLMLQIIEQNDTILDELIEQEDNQFESKSLDMDD